MFLSCLSNWNISENKGSLLHMLVSFGSMASCVGLILIQRSGSSGFWMSKSIHLKICVCVYLYLIYIFRINLGLQISYFSRQGHLEIKPNKIYIPILLGNKEYLTKG